MRATRQIIKASATAFVSALPVTASYGAAAPNPTVGFHIPSIVSDSVITELTGFFGRLDWIITTVGLILVLFVPVFVLAVLSGLREAREQKAVRARCTQPDRAFRLEPPVRSPRPTTPREEPSRQRILKAAGVALIAGIFALPAGTVLADTKRVEVTGKKSELIDVIGAIDEDLCSSLLTGPKIQSQAKNGRLVAALVWTKMPDDKFCGGKNVQVLAVEYHPNRGFTGTDTATVSYRVPPRSYANRQVNMLQTRKYIITVK